MRPSSAWLASIRKTAILALDTEGASFHRFVDRIYLLQLSTRDAHAIIDPLPITKPHGLGAILEDPKIEIVFHDADYDLRLLRQDYGWQVRNVFDTRIAAQLLGIKAFGLAALLERSIRAQARQEAPARRLVDASAHRGHARLRGAGHDAPAGAARPVLHGRARRQKGRLSVGAARSSNGSRQIGWAAGRLRRTGS
jgi:DNA polymerase I-like protein with 3'-5' exonuclease and polymerase domains